MMPVSEINAQEFAGCLSPLSLLLWSGEHQALLRSMSGAATPAPQWQDIVK
jgi:hypothetical protein